LSEDKVKELNGDGMDMGNWNGMDKWDNEKFDYLTWWNTDLLMIDD
jgi:hypothetical protein